MELTYKSTVGEILFYHPLREKFDNIILEPKNTWFGCAGPWRHVYHCQENVILRRHIRKFWPDFAAIVCLSDMNRSQLESTINRLNKSECNQ